MVRPTNGHWSLKLTRDVEQWNNEFTEHWTYNHEVGSVYYKLRVVGPNGEACRREELDKDDVPRDVRAAFEDEFHEAKKNA